MRQLLHDAKWGELDYLIIDLPPGTGDAPMSMAQEAPIAGTIIVTTPQAVAVEDAAKAVAMFEKLNVPVFGLIENMSYFITPDTGLRVEIFGHGGGREAARGAGDRLSGRDPAGRGGAGGRRPGPGPLSPLTRSRRSSQAFTAIAQRVAAKLSVLALMQV